MPKSILLHSGFSKQNCFQLDVQLPLNERSFHNWFHFQTTEKHTDNQHCWAESRPLFNKIQLTKEKSFLPAFWYQSINFMLLFLYYTMIKQDVAGSNLIIYTVWTVNDVLKSIHTLLLSRSIPLVLSRSIPFYWGYGSTQDIIDGPHCIIQTNSKFASPDKILPKCIFVECCQMCRMNRCCSCSYLRNDEE